MKSPPKKIVITAIWLAIILLSFFAYLHFSPIALGTAETRYFENDTWTTGLYNLSNTITGSTIANITIGSGLDETNTMYFGAEIAVGKADGTNQSIAGSGGNPVAVASYPVSISSKNFGVQADWTHSQTDVTGAINITIYIFTGINDNTPNTLRAKFSTENVSFTGIASGTWTFNYTGNELYRTALANSNIFMDFGSTTYNGRILNYELLNVGANPPIYNNPAESPQYLTSGENITLSVNWTTTQGNMSMAVVNWNVTGGSSQNSTWFTFPAGLNSSWANITITTPLHAEGDILFSWRQQANNTSNAWNVTSYRTLTLWRGVPAVSRWTFGLSAETPRGAFYAGAKNITYIAYQNTTTVPWNYQIRAFDTNTSAKYGPYSLSDSNGHDDGHWGPDIAFLPDGRIMYMFAYGQWNGSNTEGFYYWLSKNSAKTETNVTKLLTQWDALRVYEPGAIGGQWSYPHAVWFNDLTFLHGRKGVNTQFFTYSENQSSIQWNDGNDTTYRSWNAVGSTPYLNDGDSSYIWSGSIGAQTGYYTFQDLNLTPTNLMSNFRVNLYIYSTQLKYYVNVYLNPNGTDYLLGQITASGWASFNVTSMLNNYTLMNNAKLRLDLSSSGSIGISNITRAYLLFNYSGFSASQALTDMQYYDIAKSGNNLLYTGIDNAYANASFAYSADKGKTWKLANGTTLTIPFSENNVKIIDSTASWQTRTLNDPILDENGKPVIAEITRSNFVYLPVDRVKILTYNNTLGNSGVWNYTFAQDEFGNAINCSGDIGFFLDGWFGRPAFWSSNNLRIQKYVRIPGETYKFHSVVQDSLPYDEDFYGTPLKDTSSLYEVANREYYYNALGTTTVGSQQALMQNNDLWGTAFVANMTTTLTVAQIYVNVTSSSIHWQAAIYDNSFNLVGNTTDLHTLSYGSTEVGWQSYASFLNPQPQIVQGQTYYFTVRVDYPNAIYGYYGISSIVNQTFRITGTSFYPTIAPTEFYNRTYAFHASPVYIVIRGLGVDENPPFLTQIGTNTTVPGGFVTFHSHVEDNSNYNGSAGFLFGSNNTGAWVNQTWVALATGVNEAWANYTTTLNSGIGNTIIYRFWANDTYNNWADSGNYSLLITDNPPTYSYGASTSQLTGANSTFYVLWEDDANLSMCWFSWNGTGIQTSQSVSLSGNPSWANVSKTLNFDAGTILAYYWYANDSRNQLNTTITFYLAVLPTWHQVETWNFNIITSGTPTWSWHDVENWLLNIYAYGPSWRDVESWLWNIISLGPWHDVEFWNLIISIPSITYEWGPVFGWNIPLMNILGFMGLIMIMVAPVYSVMKIKAHDYITVLKIGPLVFFLGLAFFLAWLMGGA